VRTGILHLREVVDVQLIQKAHKSEGDDSQVNPLSPSLPRVNRLWNAASQEITQNRLIPSPTLGIPVFALIHSGASCRLHFREALRHFREAISSPP
jgi:hypothetical protein